MTLAALFDPATRPNPYPVFATLRGEPFAIMDGALVVVGDHARCTAILRDPAMSSERRRSLLGSNMDAPEDLPTTSFLSMDPPDHTRLRRLVTKAFTPRVVAALRPRIERIVDDQLAAVADAGEIDVVTQLAYPLPVRIICELLGVPESDHELFAGYSRWLVRGLDPSLSIVDPADGVEIERAQQGFRDYFTDLIARRRAEPGPDLLTDLIRIEEDGDVLSHEELLATCTLLLVAGHETTANLIANGVLALLRHPGQLAELRADPGLVSGAVEEVLRYDPPVQLTTRIVRSATRIGEVDVPADAVLLLLIGAANRDPQEFPEPDRFDIHRTPNRHLAFAAGAHFCLGSGLARLEASIALSAFTRLGEVELDEGSLTYRPHVNLRGPDHLVVRFRL